MADAQNGSAMLAGNPAANAPAGSTPAAPPASPPADGGAPPPAPAGNWYDSIEDSDLKGYLQNKGWKDPSELAVGYRNLEKLVGSEKVPLPKDAADVEGWSRVYDALGRPKTADDYKLTTLEGADPQFSKAAADKFHELGLNPKQASTLAEWYNGAAKASAEALQQEQSQKTEQALQSLKSEWGQTWSENINLGQRAAKEFGLDEAKLTAIENAMGTGDMLKFMARIGRGLTEHTFEGGKSTSGFGMTPEAAKQRLTQLRGDPDWSKQYLAGNAEARNEMARLMSVAFPE